MTRFLFIVFSILFFSLPVFADKPSRKLLNAIRQHESQGDDYAIGDKYDKDGNLKPEDEWSYGPYQIGPKYIADYNKWNKTSYKPQDCLGNVELSEKIVIAYLDHYATSKRLGHVPTDEDKARIHNGGPNGWRYTSTEGYWEKVQKYL